MKTSLLSLDGLPAMLFEGVDGDRMIAIQWNGKEWVQTHEASAFVNGAVLSKSEFDARFGHLPSPEIVPS